MWPGEFFGNTPVRVNIPQTPELTVVAAQIAATPCFLCRRLSLITGAVGKIATAAQPWMFAVASDDKRIVFADNGNLYLKTIVP